MDNLLQELEALKIRGDFCEDNVDLSPWLEVILGILAPRVTVGTERPCEEKDFREFRLGIERNLRNVRSMLPHISSSCRKKHFHLADIGQAREFGLCLLLLIGEHRERNVWNTAECISISKELLVDFCDLYGIQTVHQFLAANDNLPRLMVIMRFKMLEWKTYPAAMASYKWILQEADKPLLFKHISEVLSPTLAMLNDYFPDNVLIGLECIQRIIQHSYMEKGLVESGYLELIYRSLELLIYQKEAKYVIPTYSCMASLLATMERWDNSNNLFKWTRRDGTLSTLIENMEFDMHILDVELRHAYMSSLLKLITNVACAKWCGTIIRIFAEYCEHHTDLKTLKVTLETAKTFLFMFHMRVAAHCAPLYTVFLKLHFDLTKTPVLDRAIMQNLEDCICMLYQLSPNVGYTVINDDRIRSVLNSSLPVVCQNGDIKYFE